MQHLEVSSAVRHIYIYIYIYIYICVCVCVCVIRRLKVNKKSAFVGEKNLDVIKMHGTTRKHILFSSICTIVYLFKLVTGTIL